MARRFAWQEMGKPDPGALTVSTRCSNKLCVRHLRTRTRPAIIASVPRAKGWLSGEQSHFARTEAKTVLQLRLYAKGDLTQPMLAERFGLSPSNVKSILGRRSGNIFSPRPISMSTNSPRTTGVRSGQVSSEQYLNLF
jgi:hypothetical protein